MNRKDLEARYELFNHFALKDQRNYYRSSIRKNRESATHVNRYRALFAFLTGLSAAAAGLIVQVYFTPNAICYGDAVTELSCTNWRAFAAFFTILSVVLPAVAALFNTLADLYQWDRLITIYDAALENIEVADAQSPRPEIDDDILYRAALNAFAEGTLSVMSDETAQWGQAVRTPAQLEKFVQEARRKAEKKRKDSPREDDYA